MPVSINWGPFCGSPFMKRPTVWDIFGAPAICGNYQILHSKCFPTGPYGPVGFWWGLFYGLPFAVCNGDVRISD